MAVFKLTPVLAAEKVIQSAILKYQAVDRRVCWAERFNTSALSTMQRDKRTRELKERFVRWAPTGTPDILGQLRDGRLLTIEVKKPDGEVRRDQKEFIDRCRNCNGVALIARSIGDVVAALNAAHGGARW